MVGQVKRVLVEGPSRGLGDAVGGDGSPDIRWNGRASSNHIIHFSAADAASTKKEILTGEFADIMIEGAYAHSLWGRRVQGSMGAEP
jgi:hypothetical protein